MLGCAEINSSFNRSHRFEVCARWAAQTPPAFRFAVKLPRAITHKGKLRGARLPLQRFLMQASGLGIRLAVLLVQVPHSLVSEARPLRSFFGLLADPYSGAMMCELCCASWFTRVADAGLVRHRIGRRARRRWMRRR